MKLITFIRSMRTWIETMLGICVVVAVLAAMAAFGKARLTAAVYAGRLRDVQQAYTQLRDQYNRAVARTAVTELCVTEDTVTVVVRDDSGRVQRKPTTCDPRREVYVDYLVLDGRLWIRRVFDDATEPRKGTVIDPALGSLRWDRDTVNVGKAVYRRLTPGRWTVTVTGNGALGLEKNRDQPRAVLAPPPRIVEAATIEANALDPADDISLVEMIVAAFRHTNQAP